MEVTRTPDKLQGAENLSRALANVMDFSLQRKLEDQQRQRVMEAVAQEQQFKQQLQENENREAFGRLQADIAFRNVVDERLRKQQADELAEQIRHNKEMEKFRESEITTEGEKVQALKLLREAQAKKYENQTKVETLTKSIEERTKLLTALAPYVKEENPGAMMRTSMIMRELIPLQNELDKVRAGGTISPDISKRIYEGQREGFSEFVNERVFNEPMTTDPEATKAKIKRIQNRALTTSDLDSLANGTVSDTTQKSLEEMTTEELIQELSK